jgi:hypothetical protein
MARYVEGSDRSQVTLLPECLDDYIAEDNPVRVAEAFVEELDLEALGFSLERPRSPAPGDQLDGGTRAGRVLPQHPGEVRRAPASCRSRAS